MKHAYLLIPLSFCCFSAFAQNLVVNPSFEVTNSNCGNFGGEGFSTDLTASWNSANSNLEGDSCSSSDLFSVCNEVFGISVTGMPDNELGWQYARTGTRYVGIITHDPLSNYREYIQGRTSTPMAAGQQYCVSMFVSRGDNVPFATNNVGVYFTNSEYMRDACQGSLINVTPQLNYNCSPITDTTNWVRLQWTYTAAGGEQYFTIGNFYNNANTTIVNVGGGGLNAYAYYYIDDVSITAGGECCYADIAAVGPKCLNDAAVTLTATPPIGADCTPSVTGTWSGPGTNASTGVFTPSLAGTGTHTINFTLSCGYVASTTITVNACAELTICSNANGSLTVSGGSGSYTWASQSTVQDCSGCPFGICSPICTGVTATVWTTFSTSATATPPGTWPIRVTDGQGGIVTLNNANGIAACEGAGCGLSLGVGNVVNACSGNTGSATVSVTGSSGTLGYSWDSDPVQTTATATELASGEYTVTVTDANCSRALTFVIQSGAVVADAGEDQTICKGDATTLNATGGTSYAWNNGAGSGASVSVAPGSTTTYTVTATSGTCSDADDIVITVVQPPTTTIQQAITSFCEGASPVEIQGSPTGGTFTGPGMNGSTFNPSQAGVGTHTISYTYYEVVECPSTATVDLTVDVCTGISDRALETVSIRPNPTNGMVTVEMNGLDDAQVQVELFDAVGRTITVPTQRTQGHAQITMDLTGLSGGLYVVRVQSEEETALSV